MDEQRCVPAVGCTYVDGVCKWCGLPDESAEAAALVADAPEVEAKAES